MSVVGFDVGSFTSYIAIARAGGLEVLTNEYSERHNPTCISINDRERAVGHASKQQEINNVANTFKNFKRFIGRNFSDPVVKKEMKYLPFAVQEGPLDTILIKAKYDGQDIFFTPQQLYAMMLSKLCSVAFCNTGVKVVDCVISTPMFTTDLERRAMKEAAQIAGLNCMRLMNDSAAVALNYGMYKAELPGEKELPKIVIFVDMGYCSLQVCAVAFNKNKCQVIGVSFDSCTGGRDFDMAIVEHCCQDIKKRYSIDVRKNVRGWLRLQNQCERTKKMMSTISSNVPVDVECLVNDNDYHGQISKTEFEEICSDILQRTRNVLEEILLTTNLTPSDISSVEIVGGSTRIPAIKNLIKEVYKQEPHTTLNADEAVARGCTLMCAILSPSFRVRQINVVDIQPFPITISWKSQENDDTSREVFTIKDNFPLTKMVRVNKPQKSSMEIEARYTYPNNIPYGEARIGYFLLDGLKSDQKDMTKVKFRVRINNDGIFEMKQAQLYDQSANTQASVEENQENTEMKSTEESKNVENEDASEKPPVENSFEDKESKVQKKVTNTIKTIDLVITPKVKQLTRGQLMVLQEQEVEMLAVDKREKEKADSKNAVEEYIYDMRDKMNSIYIEFATNNDKNNIIQHLMITEEWLNDTNLKTEKREFDTKLIKMKELTDPIVKRYKDFNDRPHCIQNLAKSLRDIIQVYNAWYAGDQAYSHLTKEDMTKVHNAVEQKKTFIDSVYKASESVILHINFPLSCDQIKQAKNELETVCLPIINRSKPIPPKPAPPAETKTETDENENCSQTKEESMSENTNDILNDDALDVE